MRRALHFVFKVADRKATIDFYRNVLGMKVLLIFHCLRFNKNVTFFLFLFSFSVPSIT